MKVDLSDVVVDLVDDLDLQNVAHCNVERRAGRGSVNGDLLAVVTREALPRQDERVRLDNTCGVDWRVDPLTA